MIRPALRWMAAHPPSLCFDRMHLPQPNIWWLYSITSFCTGLIRSGGSPLRAAFIRLSETLAAVRFVSDTRRTFGKELSQLIVTTDEPDGLPRHVT